jgi:hypothetical protein
MKILTLKSTELKNFFVDPTLASKRASQKAILKAQDDLCAQMVSTASCTTNGCHCQPTKNKTY